VGSRERKNYLKKVGGGDSWRGRGITGTRSWGVQTCSQLGGVRGEFGWRGFSFLLKWACWETAFPENGWNRGREGHRLRP